MPDVSFDDLIPQQGGAPAPAAAASAPSFDDLVPQSTATDVAKSAATGLDKGIAGVLGMPSDLWRMADRGFQNAATWGLQQLGAITPEQAAGMRAPIPAAGEDYNYGSDTFNKAFSDASGGYHTPQTTAGKYTEAVSSFLPGALAMGAKTAGGIPSALMKYGVLPGLGDEAGGQLTEGTAIEPYARVGGSLLGGTLGSTGLSLASKGVNAARGVTNPVLDAYKDLGVDPVLAGDVTGSPFLQGLQAFATKAPFSAGRMEAAGQNAVNQFGNAIEDTASSLGSSRTAADAGNALQAAARDWRDNVFPQRQAAAWAPVDAAISPVAAVRPVQYRAALAKLSSSLAGLPETKKVLLSDRAQSLLGALNQDVPVGAGMSWPEAQNLRSVIGEIRGVPEIAGSIGDKQLGAMYGALSNDMRTTAGRYGVADAFDAANAVSTQGHSFVRNTLSKIIKANNPLQESVRPEQAADAVLNGGDTTLQAVRQELPQAANELAAYKLRDMALANAGKQGSAGTTVSPGTFLTDYNNLRMRSPAGTQALFSDPAVAQKINSAAIVADTMKKTAAKLNTSNTGPFDAMHAVIALPETIAAGAYAGHEMAGPLGAVAGGLFGAIPPLSGIPAGLLTSSPRLTRYLATPGTSPASPSLLGASVAPRLLQGP